MEIKVFVADESHLDYAEAICKEIEESAKESKLGLAKRTPEYIIEKMKAQTKKVQTVVTTMTKQVDYGNVFSKWLLKKEKVF